MPDTLKHIIRDALFHIISRVSPKTYAGILYRRCFHKRLNWKSPETLDEKLNWLKIYSDTDRWVDLTDKYLVRNYVSGCGLSDMLVKLYGKWDDVSDIDWDILPERFIIKTNNASGVVFICNDKSRIDKRQWCRDIKEQLDSKFGYFQSEPHYNRIKPCIIAEELLDCTKQQMQTTSLIDYKIWSFDGKPEYIQACWNRTKDGIDVGIYDLDWNFHPEYSVPQQHCHLADEAIPRPESLDRMLQAASILSKGFPEVRVDFYEVGGKPYFGEMTFTSGAGLNSDYSDEFQRILGSKITLR